jgi:hypothetical protein
MQPQSQPLLWPSGAPVCIPRTLTGPNVNLGTDTPNNAIGASGSMTASTFADNTLNGNHNTKYTGVNVTANTSIRASLWIARGTGANNRYVRLWITDGGSIYGFYSELDLQAGTASGPTALGTGAVGTATITPVGTGFNVTVSGKLSTAFTDVPTVWMSSENAPNSYFYVGTGGQCFAYESIGLCVFGSHDPYISNVVLLLGFEDVNGSTTTPGMTDESPSVHGTATVVGTAVISTGNKKFGTASLNAYNGGNGAITWPDSNDWYFSTSNFTVELWIYPLAYGSANSFILSQWDHLGNQHAWVLWFNVNQLSWNTAVAVTDNNFDIAAPASTPSINAWHHIAVDCDGAKVRMYSDGVMIGSTTTVRNLANCTAKISIGMDAAGLYPFQGYVDEVRITKGVARYASDAGFVVPTAPFPRN